MRDHYDFGATPAGENCAQTGSVIYEPIKQQRIEIDCFKDFLERTFRKPPQDFIRWEYYYNPHDFGTYLSLRAHFIDSEVMWDWLNDIDAIERWDATALQYLNTHGYAFEEILGEDRLYQSPKLQNI